MPRVIIKPKGSHQSCGKITEVSDLAALQAKVTPLEFEIQAVTGAAAAGCDIVESDIDEMIVHFGSVKQAAIIGFGKQYGGQFANQFNVAIADNMNRLNMIVWQQLSVNPSDDSDLVEGGGWLARASAKWKQLTTKKLPHINVPIASAIVDEYLRLSGIQPPQSAAQQRQQASARLLAGSGAQGNRYGGLS